MDFTLTSEQRLIAETVRDFVESELYPHEDEVERLDEIPAGLASAIRGKALAAGLYAANMPAELGGGGLDALSVVLVERELGRASYGCRCWSNGPATSCWPARANSGSGTCCRPSAVSGTTAWR